MKPFEIFRTGKHTSSQGAALTFGDVDLASIAANYDPAQHQAPIVVGHPKQDAPAYGWIKALEVKGDRLVAVPDQIDAAFSDLVKAGAFKKVSAAFYHPTSANNPTPGQYHLRHVGFLGAQAPAVKGLKAIEFSDADSVVVELEEIDFSEWRNAWGFENIVRVFRGLREHFIETADVETADRILPQWDIEQLAQVAADSRADARVEEARTSFSEPENKPEESTMTKTAEERQAELDAREAEIAARETTFAEQERAARNADDAAFVASIVQDGRLPIGLQASATALFSELDEQELTFSEGDTAVKSSPRALFRDLLGKLPKPVATGELATGDGPDFSDPVHVQTAIETEMRKAKENGETISPATAAMRLKANG